MKRARHLLVAVFVILMAVIACQKNSGGGSSEDPLVVETLPLANGHVEAPAPGPDFPLIVTIKSAMPPGGIKIDVTAKPDGGTVAFFTTSKTNNTTANTFSITGSTPGVVSLVEITVTSVSSSSNKWTGTYKFSRK